MSTHSESIYNHIKDKKQYHKSHISHCGCYRNSGCESLRSCTEFSSKSKHVQRNTNIPELAGQQYFVLIPFSLQPQLQLLLVYELFVLHNLLYPWRPGRRNCFHVNIPSIVGNALFQIGRNSNKIINTVIMTHESSISWLYETFLFSPRSNRQADERIYNF